MKKAVLLLCLMISGGCANDYLVFDFKAYMSSDDVNEEGATLVALTKNDSVHFNQMINFLSQFFKDIGWEIVENKKDANFGFGLIIKRSSTPYVYSQPVWGEKNISRTRANSFGGVDVDYDIGITGYRQVTAYQNETLLYLQMKRLRDSKPLLDVILHAFFDAPDKLMVYTAVEGILQSGLQNNKETDVQFRMQCKTPANEEGFFCQRMK